MSNKIKFSEEQIIEWSKRPEIKDVRLKNLCIGDFISHTYKFYGADITEFGIVTKIYYTMFHQHKRIKVVFYNRWGDKKYRIFKDNGDLYEQ